MCSPKFIQSPDFFKKEFMKKAGRYKRNKETNWIEVKNDYLFNKLSLRDLAKKYNVSFSAVSKHSRQENWVEEKENTAKQIESEVIQKNTKSEIDRLTQINETHIETFTNIQNIINEMLRLYKENVNKIKREENNRKALNSLIFGIKSLAETEEKIQKGHRVALNADKQEIEDSEPQVFVIKGLDEDKI